MEPKSYEPLKSTEGLVESGDLTDKDKSLGQIGLDAYNQWLPERHGKFAHVDQWDYITQAVAAVVVARTRPRWIPLEESKPKAGTCVLLGRGKLSDPDTFQAQLFHSLPEGVDYVVMSWTHWYPIEEPRP